MAVPAMTLYASSPSNVCSTPSLFQINSHPSHDFEVNSRSSSLPPPTASAAAQKPMIGGLSCLFSSPTVKHTSSSSTSFTNGVEELGSSSLRRDQSPVSVFQGPISCGSSADVPGYASIRIGSNGLFHGFVRSALESCIDYDSPSFDTHDDGIEVDALTVFEDELTFDLEDANTDPHTDPFAKDLLLGAQLRHKIFSDEFVVKAFCEAEKAHRGQMRASGDPYLQHCVETGVLLALVGADSTVVAAGMLHDTCDDAFISYEHILTTFGGGVAKLVEGVSKLSQLSKLARVNNTANKTTEANRLHTMFLAMADARAVLIKLADRLHNMMTLDALPLNKQQRFAKETLEIFVPLANRLGICNWKDQLENLCLKHLYPDQHREISSKLLKSFDESVISTAIMNLEHALKDGAISYHILSGRHKSLYSIYRKMLRKKLSIDKIHDIHGLRLIVETEEDCYKALKIIQRLWSEIPGKLKDYINCPKFNGYQSLHTVVLGEGMVPLEVQIRTKEMHVHAELGFAAHWRYKESDCTHSSFVLQMVKWARWVVTWHLETIGRDRSSVVHGDSVTPPCAFPSHADGCPYTYKPSCGDDGPIFVILLENDKMSVQELPTNSTMMDLLERGGRGSHGWTYSFPLKEELRPRLNHKPVADPTCKLSMGDVVELTPPIPPHSLTECREEIQRMYERGHRQSAAPNASSALASLRS